MLTFTRKSMAQRCKETANQNKIDCNKTANSGLTNNNNLLNASEMEANLYNDIYDENNFDDDYLAENFNDYDDEMANLINVSSQPKGVSNLTNPYWILNDWIAYEQRECDVRPFSRRELKAIKLLSVLRQGRASLATYDDVMHWHCVASGVIHPHELATSHHYLKRKALFDMLKKRYNRDSGYGIVTELVLPHRKSRVKMVTNDCGKIVQSLLTRPELKGDHYLFFDKDPFARPPDDLDYIADLNTGKCYSATYDQLIKDPNTEILLPFIAYMDGSAMCNWTQVELTRFQIALGIVSREERKHEHNWGTLGWIPNIPKDKSQGRRAFVDSGHAESMRHAAKLDHDEGLMGNIGRIHRSQDLHTMISFVLQGFTRLTKTGFKWDLFYNGRLYKNITFRPFVAFIRCDTKEANLICGKYCSSTRHVRHICRECDCPTASSDDHTANFRAKTKERIAKLVARMDKKALQAMSQQCLQNAFCDAQFGLHNKMGVHGACPMEMLHQLLLGIFKYVREIFFDYVGEKSTGALEIDALAMIYGELLGRQSDRDLPDTRFPGGIRAGKINAKKFTGILLCLLMAISCTKGRKALEKKTKWRELGVIDDWILLIVTLLHWEAWLSSPKLKKTDVHRAKTKHRHIMCLVRHIAERKKGMGLKFNKFHGILHIADAILNFGVPLEHDTGDDEHRHILSKQAAQLTQRDLSKLEQQAAERMLEMELLGLAKLEMTGSWLVDYRFGKAEDRENNDNLHHKSATRLGGAVYKVSTDAVTGGYTLRTVRELKGKDPCVMVEQDLTLFMLGLKHLLAPFMEDVFLHSCYHRDGHIFRADVNYREQVWRDWVVVNWGRDGQLPNKIYGFVDLRMLPTTIPRAYQIDCGGLRNISPGIYAIVEATEEGCEGHRATEMFDILTTEVGGFVDGKVTQLKFYLADVDAFVAPCTVVPNIGGPSNCYFWIKSRSKWANVFVDWLRAPHLTDVMEDLTAIEKLKDAEELEHGKRKSKRPKRG
jgi:hypothetical protein